MKDSEKVPLFCRALAETDQKHVVRLLGFEGLHVFVSYLFYICTI